MKRLSILFLLILSKTYSQVGIGTSSPDLNSDLTLGSPNKGLRLNLVNLENTTDNKVGGLSEGMLVYNTSSVNGMNPGLYIASNSTWNRVLGTSDFLGLLIASSYSSQKLGFWKIGGNSEIDPVSNFLGTTDSTPLIFKTNDTNRLMIEPNGNIGIGIDSPREALDIAGNIQLSGAIMPAGLAGTSGQVLYSRGAGNAPTWGDLSTVTDATTTVKGVLQLAGDLSGTATTPTIANNAINSAKILNGTILNEDLALGAVNSEKIIDAGVQNIDLAPDTGGIYKGSGTLKEPTTVNQAANTLAFTSTAINGFSVDGSTLSVDAANNRIGLGTIAPVQTLDVTGTALFRKGNQHDVIKDNEQILFSYEGSSRYKHAIRTRHDDDIDLGINNAIDFYTWDLETQAAETDALPTKLGLTINHGRVGIGNNLYPTEVLDVTGNMKFSGALMPANLAGTSGQVLLSKGAGNAPVWGDLPTVTDATTTLKGVLQLAGDLSGTATTPTIANNAINSAKIADGSVANLDLAVDAITTDKIKDGNVTNQDLASDAVTSAKIADGSIANIDLAPDTGGIYKGSGTLKGPTTVNQAANTLAFTSTAINGFSVDGSTLSVDAANNRIGLGTIAPVQTLDVTGTALFRKGSEHDVINTNEQILFSYGGTSDYKHAIRTRHDNSLLVGINNAIDFYTWDLETQSATPNALPTKLGLTINHGRVGIGNNLYPTEVLDVTGNMKFSGALMPANLAGTSGQVLLSKGAGNAPVWGDLPTVTDATTTLKGVLQLAGDLSGTATTPTIANNAINSAKIADGSVANLDLAVDAGGIYKGSGTLKAATTVNQAANTLAFTSTAVNGFSIDGTTFSVDAANNRIGLGNTTPVQPLDVTGTALFRNGGQNTAFTGNEQFLFGYSATNDYKHSIRTRHDNRPVNNENSIDLYTWDATTDGVTGLPTKHGLTVMNGKVGIGGITTPTEALHVAGKTRTTNLQVTNGAGSAGHILTSDANGNASWAAVASINATASVLGVYTGSGYSGASNVTFANTGATITLPPGKWAINTSILVEASNIPAAGQGAWIRLNWSSSSSALNQSDVLAGYHVTCAYYYPNQYNVARGLTVVHNQSGANKTYYLVKGPVDNTAGYILNFQNLGNSAGENSIVAQPIN